MFSDKWKKVCILLFVQVLLRILNVGLTWKKLKTSDIAYTLNTFIKSETLMNGNPNMFP